MKNMNLPIVMHIHDEIVVEVAPHVTLESVMQTMSIVPSWGKGLILNADAFECEFYKKD